MNLQVQSPQSTRTLHIDVQEVEQAGCVAAWLYSSSRASLVFCCNVCFQVSQVSSREFGENEALAMVEKD